jgi:hypothetical protein
MSATEETTITANTISYRNPTRTTKGVPKRKEPSKFEYNNMDVKAYLELDLPVPETVGRWERKFLSMVDVSKEPIQRNVYSMVRLKARDYDSNSETLSKERKEWLYYVEQWTGVNQRGLPLNPVAEHYEGVWTKQYTKPHLNQETGEIDYYELDAIKSHKVYTIPFSKKAVDTVISNSANTDKDSIRFTIKFGESDNPFGTRQMPTRNIFTYEQFVMPWNEIYKLNFKPTTQAYMEWVAKEKQKDNLSFQPQ